MSPVLQNIRCEPRESSAKGYGPVSFLMCIAGASILLVVHFFVLHVFGVNENISSAVAIVVMLLCLWRLWVFLNSRSRTRAAN